MSLATDSHPTPRAGHVGTAEDDMQPIHDHLLPLPVSAGTMTVGAALCPRHDPANLPTSGHALRRGPVALHRNVCFALLIQPLGEFRRLLVSNERENRQG